MDLKQGLINLRTNQQTIINMKKNGFYWVRRKCENKWTIGKFYSDYWMFPGDEQAYFDGEIEEIDETPIERSIRPNLQNGLPLSTLKETLSDFPDSLIVTRVSIEMHNKYSIQITEFNIEANAKQEERNKEENV